jgi:hypothetical protein
MRELDSCSFADDIAGLSMQLDASSACAIALENMSFRISFLEPPAPKDDVSSLLVQTEQ